MICIFNDGILALIDEYTFWIGSELLVSDQSNYELSLLASVSSYDMLQGLLGVFAETWPVSPYVFKCK